MEATAGSQLATWGPKSSSGVHVWGGAGNSNQDSGEWGRPLGPMPPARGPIYGVWVLQRPGLLWRRGRAGWQDTGEGSGQLVRSGRTPGGWWGADRRAGVMAQGRVGAGGQKPCRGQG